MTSRGFASLQVAAGLPEVLGCQWVAGHAVEVQPGDGPGRAIGDDMAGFLLTCSDKGYDSAVIDLDGVNWFDDAALIDAAPHAAWQVYLGVDTEQPGLWLAYTPGTGLVEASHVDHDVLVPVDWADPATRTGAEDRQLARITTVRAALDGLAQAADPGATVRELRRGTPAATSPGVCPRPGGPNVRATQPVFPTAPAAGGPAPGSGNRGRWR